MNKLTARTIYTSLFLLPAIMAVVLLPQMAAAQGLPSTLRGDLGLKSGSQGPPGIYVTGVVYNYPFDTLVTNNGREISGNTTISQTLPGMAFTYVSEKKILGAHYSATWVLAFVNVRVDSPRQDQTDNFGVTDMFFQPIQLGWHFKYADMVAGYGIYVPTGRFTAGAPDNNGLGQWSHELTYGFTLYPNEKKTLHLATLASYNIQSTIRGTDQKVGDTLTLEGGVGVGLMKGLMNTGLAYYTQWKMTEDRVPSILPPFRGKHRYIGLGPEFNTVLPISKTTPVFATFRYLFETENRVATKGNTLFFALTVLIPGKQ